MPAGGCFPQAERFPHVSTIIAASAGPFTRSFLIIAQPPCSASVQHHTPDATRLQPMVGWLLREDRTCVSCNAVEARLHSGPATSSATRVITEFVITEGEKPKRLDVFLANRERDLSRS